MSSTFKDGVPKHMSYIVYKEKLKKIYSVIHAQLELCKTF